MAETNRIEYKEKLTKDLDMEKEVVAFLNYRERFSNNLGHSH